MVMLVWLCLTYPKRNIKVSIGNGLKPLSLNNNTVHKGDRIAQLVLERILIAEIEEVDVSLLMSVGNQKFFIIILLELGLDRERCWRFWINREKLTINSKAGKKDLHAYMSQEK